MIRSKIADGDKQEINVPATFSPKREDVHMMNN